MHNKDRGADSQSRVITDYLISNTVVISQLIIKARRARPCNLPGNKVALALTARARLNPTSLRSVKC